MRQNDDCGRKIWPISKISPSLKAKFTKVVAIAGGGRFCLTALQTLGWYNSLAWAKREFCQNCGASLFYRFNGICRALVAIGMFDDANDLVIAGQIFANSQPHWDRLRPYDLPHLDGKFWGKKS